MHIPVLLNEVLGFLDPKPGKKYIDATIGAGGHAQGLLERGAYVLGIDRDSRMVQSFASGARLQVVHGNFSDLQKHAEDEDFVNVDGILLDLGLGSHQLDDASRGFSFQKSGPLDMRYDTGQKLTAEELVNNRSEKELVNIFFRLGEEKRFGRKIAAGIVTRRKKGEAIQTTDELFDLIKTSLPAKFRFRSGDVARKIFQSLRITVNGELENLEKALPQAVNLLKAGGRVAVISFHSLEDRIVKIFFNTQARDCVCPPSFPICRCSARAHLRILTKKPVTASPEEILKNSRARSAKLRVAEKLETKN